jgi:hypothetical protein
MGRIQNVKNFSYILFVLASVVFCCVTGVAWANDGAEYLLPKDFKPFDKQEFRNAYEGKQEWDMEALVHDMYSGDALQRSTWAGTQRKLDIKQFSRVTLALEKLVPNVSAKRAIEKSSTLNVRFRRTGAVLSSRDFVDIRYISFAKIKLIESAQEEELKLKDGSTFYFVSPKHRWPGRQGAILMCYRPHYSMIKHSKAKKTTTVSTDSKAFFANLTYDLTYEVNGKYITGDQKGIGRLAVYVSPNFFPGLIEEDQIESTDPFLEISGEKRENIKIVTYDGVNPLRSNIVAVVDLKIPGGKRGTFLQHKVTDIYPANEAIPWVQDIFQKKGSKNILSEETAECVYYVEYVVNQEIYGRTSSLAVGVE